MNKINYLASYPKSGNTWWRIFLDSYIKDSVPDINCIDTTFSDCLDKWHEPGFSIDLHGLDDVYQVLTHQMALLRIACLKSGGVGNGGVQYPLILKTHQTNLSVSCVEMFPAQLTGRVLYIVRDPRDVCMSYAKHFGLSIDATISAIISDKTNIADADSKRNNVHQFISSWSNHVSSFVNAENINVLVIKFEDMKKNPKNAFISGLEWFGIEVDEDRVERTIDSCDISKLRKQEIEHGFNEASAKSDRFFGDGLCGGWSMSFDQESRLIAGCREMMIALKYLDA